MSYHELVDPVVEQGGQLRPVLLLPSVDIEVVGDPVQRDGGRLMVGPGDGGQESGRLGVLHGCGYWANLVHDTAIT